MLKKIVYMLMAAAAIATSGEAGMWEKMRPNIFKEPATIPTMKVLVVHDADAVVVEVKGKYNIYDPFKQERLGTRFVGKSNLIQPLAGGLKWGEEFPGVYQIAIVPDEQKITTVVDGIEYRGKIFIYDIGGAISIVNEVDLEDYLNSILALQFKESRSVEALAAVAIVERTHALYQSMHPKNPYWHVRAEDVDYNGYAITNRGNDIEKALSSTRYIVMSATEGEKLFNPFAAKWSPGSPAIKSGKESQGAVLALGEAEAQAQKGMHAAQILSKTYPEASLVYVKDILSVKPVE